MSQKKNEINRKKIATLAILGVIFVLLAVLVIFLDPIFIIAKYKLRLSKGSILHEVLKSELKGARLALYLYNVTNADHFLAGIDYKLKVQDIGPFVYQEFRTNEDIVFDSEAQLVHFTPKVRTVFMPEESIGTPEDFIINVPNAPLLLAGALLRDYPFLVRSLYSTIVTQLRSKAIIQINGKDFMWGYYNPIVKIGQSLIPGLVYYNTSGILERLYDEKAEYRIAMGTSEADRFQVKTVHRYMKGNNIKSNETFQSKMELNNTYEGAAFATNMSPRTPISLFHIGVCKLLHLKYVGTRQMQYGAEAFVYDFDESTFDNKHLCDSKGSCPKHMIDISDCFFGLPAALSRTHLLGTDARLLERLDGIRPDAEKYTSSVIIDPKIGVTVGTSLFLQLNLILNDLSYIDAAKHFSDMVVPMSYANCTFPELPSETKSSLSLMYVFGPKVLISLEVVSCVVGVVLFIYCIGLIVAAYRGQSYRTKGTVFNAPLQLRGKLSVELPLI